MVIDGERRTLAFIVVAGFLVRLILLSLRGDYLVFDEAYYLLLARSLRDHQSFMLNGLPHVALSPLQPLLVAILSLPGWSDIWTSRLVGALAGSLLAIPVWLVAARIGGRRAAMPAALLAVLSPALMSYLPFFPGQSWNLYFGSEPLFVCLAFGACASAMFQRPVITGLLCGAAFLTRAEGVVLAPLVLLLLAIDAARARTARAWRGAAIAGVIALLVSAPYLMYLRGALGRWAFSGRVQAASTAAAPSPSTVATAQRGGSVLDDFVWGGDQSRFRAELYGLTPDGRRMQSQYWGVDTSRAVPVPDSAVPAPAVRAPATDPQPPRSKARTLTRAMATLLPWWLLLVGVVGYALAWRTASEMRWLLPPAAGALIPVFAAYVEPRVLLPLVPIAAIGAALAWNAARRRLEQQRPAAALVADIGLAVMIALLVLPLARHAVGAAANDTPLQQLASAQRAVGEKLAENVAPDATIMSWHPAIAVYARRDWRVMPEASLDRTLAYASRRADLVVFSRFHSSALANPPRPFTVVLLEGDTTPPAQPLTLEQLDMTPVLFVGRMRRAGR